MKRIRLIVAISLVALAAFMTIGCQQEEDTRTAEECMDQFAAAVNSGNLDGIHDCLSSTVSTAPNAEFWDTYFNKNLDSGIFVATVNGTTATAEWGGYVYTFYLEEDGKDFYAIYQVDRNGETIFP